MSQGQDKLAALQAGLGVISQRVFAPAFLGALADAHGIVPQTEKQAAALLRMGEQLLMADQAQAAKQAEADGDFYSAAADYLEQQLAGSPADAGHADPRLVKRAAAQFLGDPEVAAALAAVRQATIAG